MFSICGWLIVLVATDGTEMPYPAEVLFDGHPNPLEELANTKSWALPPAILTQ